MAKQELEFFDPAGLPWRRPEGYPEGAMEQIIAEDENGAFTRLLRFAPGTEGTETLIHDCWEEVYIIEGELLAGDQVYSKGMVAVRPPGMPHGPFRSPKGALMFEVHYYSSDQAR